MKNGWIISNNTRWHYVNDVLHNDNGPAVIYSNGDESWFRNDKLHRLDGPAVNWASRYTWYYHGLELSHISSLKEFEQWLRLKIFM